MYTLLHSIPLKMIVVQQIPTLCVSLIIAETFYKFHSFTLEVVAFLATWWALDAVADFSVKRFGSRKKAGG